MNKKVMGCILIFSGLYFFINVLIRLILDENTTFVVTIFSIFIAFLITFGLYLIIGNQYE